MRRSEALFARSADAKAPVGQGQRAAAEHYHRSEPNERHEGIEIKPDDAAALRCGVAHDHVEIARQKAPYPGLGGRLIAGPEAASLGDKGGDLAGSAPDAEAAGLGGVIGAGARRLALERHA